VQVIAEHAAEGVAGGRDHGTTINEPRRYGSNVALLQLVPRVTAITPAAGTTAAVLRVTGVRLWHARARVAEVIVGDAAVAIRPPGPGDPWAAPTPTVVEVPVADAAALLPPPAGDVYPVAVQLDGARSRDAGFDFTLNP